MTAAAVQRGTAPVEGLVGWTPGNVPERVEGLFDPGGDAGVWSSHVRLHQRLEGQRHRSRPQRFGITL
ncbi:MAG: hypothetical protein ACRDHG_00900, partial [Anaerolineales bacterium]